MSNQLNKKQCLHCKQLISGTQSNCDFCGQRLPWGQISQPITPIPNKRFDVNEFVGLTDRDRSAKGIVLSCLAGALATALPFLFVAIVNVASSKNAMEQHESWAKSLGFAVVGGIFASLAAVAAGKKATVFVIAPILFMLSLYFMMNYRTF